MKQPPVPGWTAARVAYPVRIPNLEGDGFAETVTLEIDAWKNQEGEIFLDGDANELIEKTRARHMGLILPEAIRELREQLELTQEQISALLQIGKRTWTRWETGKERPSRSMNLLLQALYDGKLDMNYLRCMKDPALRLKPLSVQRQLGVRPTYHISAVRQSLDENLTRGS